MLRKLACISTIFAVFACGSEEDPGPPPMMVDPNVDLAALCDVVAEAECERLMECGHLSAPITLELCKRRIAEGQCAPVNDQLVKIVAARHATYDPAKGGACRDAVEAATCDVGLKRNIFGEPACTGLVTGASGEGGSCTIDASCTDGLFCDATANRCPGVCQAFKTNNAACGAGEICAPDLFCSVTARRCRARVSLGAQCEISGDNSCVDGTFCSNAQPPVPMCVVARGRGTACRSPFECASGLVCRRGLCSAGEDGDTCDFDFDCQGDMLCGGNNRCAAPVALGDQCAVGAAKCEEGLTCTSSAGMELCAVQPVIGEACSATLPCYIGTCVNNECVEPVADGGSCMTAADCLPNRICDDGLCAPPFSCRL